MNASFDLNHNRLAGDSKFASATEGLNTLSRIDSKDTFNRIVEKHVCSGMSVSGMHP